jgi:DNA-binding SARP family transcriptional activator/WD40 repeat protein
MTTSSRPTAVDMRFEVLGPLRVWRAASVELTIAGRARRRLLAALVARAGQAVPASTLIDELWGELAPRSAAKTLQSHVVRLRADLGAYAETVLVTERAGYRLATDAAHVDVLEFEALVAQARAAHDPLAAIALLDRALSLWQGDDAYVEFVDAPFAIAQRLRLNEMRVEAREHLTDCALQAGRAADLIPELEARVLVQPYRERGWEQLMLAKYRSGRQADALATYRRVRDLLAGELGVDPTPALRDLEARILRQEELVGNRPQAVRLGVRRAGCPYRGLDGFSDHDVEVFVGRERLTAELAGMLASARLVVVTGQSGSGKTSLLRAGLLPALKGGALPGSAGWSTALCTPHNLQTVNPSDLLVVDQVEELFTGVIEEVRRGAVATLREQLSAGGRLVLAIRSDFFGELAALGSLATGTRATLLVRPMRDDEIRRAIVEPAARYGLDVEDGLVDAILDDLGDQRAALPLLAAALVRTWERRDPDGRLTVAAYRSAGGFACALDASAEDAFARLSPEQQTAARRLLVRLAMRNGETWVRHPMRRDEVTDGSEQAAVDVLARNRLLAVGEERVELVHDALLTEWQRLHGWLIERAVDADVVAHLAQAAKSWQSAGRADTDLYRGARLSSALEMRARFADDLSPIEAEFLAAGELAASAELTEARQRADREAAGRRRLRLAVIVLVPLFVIAVIGVALAAHETSSAHHQTAKARASALAADARRLAALALSAPDLRTSLLLAVASYRLQPSTDTRSALLSVLQNSGQARYRISTTNRLLWLGAAPGTTTVLAADNTATLLRYDTKSRRLIGSFPIRADHVDALSPNGDQLVVSGPASPEDVSGASRVTVLDAMSGAVVRVLAGTQPLGAAGWHAAAYTGNGHWLAMIAAASHDPQQPGRDVEIFDTRDYAARPRLVRLDSATSGITASHHDVVATTASGRIYVIDPQRGTILASGRQPSLASTLSAGTGLSIAVSGDGRRLAATTGDGKSVVLLSLSDLNASPTPAQIPADLPSLVSFSPDGTKLAVGGQDGTVGVVNPRTGASIHTYAGGTGQVFGVPWGGQHGTQLFSGGLDSQIVAWAGTSGPRMLTTYGKARPDAVLADLFGHDVIAVESTPELGGESGRPHAVVLDTVTGNERIFPLHLPATTEVNGVAADDRDREMMLSIRAHDGVEHCSTWNLQTGQQLGALTPTRRRGAQIACAISNDDTTAVATLPGNRVRTYTLPGFAVRRTVPVHLHTPTQARSSLLPWTAAPNGDLLVYDADPGPPPVAPPTNGPQRRRAVGHAAPTNNVVALVDPATGQVSGETGLGAQGLMDVHWSPDGQRAVAATDAGRLELLNGNTLRSLVPSVVAADGFALAASFSPNGGTIVATGTDGTMTFWDGDTLQRIGGQIKAPTSDWWFAYFGGNGQVSGLEPVGDGKQQPMRFPGDPAVWVRTACAVADSDLTRAEWAEYVGDRPFQSVCS